MKSPRLLIVDDEGQIRDMLSRHFRYLGYTVACAEHGRAALAHLACEPVHVLITDLKMPEMDGHALLRQVRSEYPLVRCLVITGYVSLMNAMACMQEGADAMIPKPLNDLRQLEAAIVRSLAIIDDWLSQLRELQRAKPLTDPFVS